jgi:hypothetical protein
MAVTIAELDILQWVWNELKSVEWQADHKYNFLNLHKLKDITT